MENDNTYVCDFGSDLDIRSDEKRQMTETEQHIRVFHRREGRVVKRGLWSVSGNHVFGRCHCGGLTLRGVCQACGYAQACLRCNSVRQPDDSWRKQIVLSTAWNISHGMCPTCAKKDRAERKHKLNSREAVEWNWN